ncbi:hypothetical protein [Amycolatopsis acidicola]|uniref:hypothetical protein n=1 Tax=Amycolatopsis acidicola TaxID=2596893 RepID=UPI00140D05D2|nr:hypothetical protein [Amycolatopsis acidicola]
MRCVELSDEETLAELEKTTPPEYVSAFFEFYRDGILDEATLQPGARDFLTAQPL